jgi:uncharacterized protein
MSLSEKINNEIQSAMLSKDKVRLETLRSIKSAFLLAKTEKGGSHDLTQEQEIKIIQRLFKQRNDSADIYKQQKRIDLYEKEMKEASILKEYLPEQMSEEDLTQALKEIIAEVGASSSADIGKVMGIAAKKLAGKADGKTISAKARELLG